MDIGKDWTPRQRLRAIQAIAGTGAVLFHVMVLFLMRPDPRLPRAEGADPSPPFVVTLVRPPRPVPEPAERRDRARRPEREEPRPLTGPNPRALPSIESLGPSAGPPRNPGPPGGRTPGIVWGGDPVQDAARRALRGAAGCGLEIPLTQRERNGCDERMGRDWRKGARTRPLMADRERQAEFDRDADYRLRLKEYKEAPPPAGLFKDLRDMGGGQAIPTK